MVGIDGEKPGGPPVDRAQSSVVGVILVVAITVMGVTGVLVFGTGALEDARGESELDAAEHAMTQLDSRFSLVALGAAKYHSSSVTLRSGSNMRVDGDAGWMNVSVINRSTGDLEIEVLNESLGAVIYENDGTTIAYQGGGVWKRSSGGSVMVSPPEFHYRTRGGEDPTLTLPIVVVRGSGSIGEDASVSKNATIEKYPVTGDSTRTNPLDKGQINVTVHSEYYRAWGSFFEERTGGTVTYDDARETVTITLVVEGSSPVIEGGIVSGASGNTLDFQNQAEADSYNSSVGNYATTSADNTSIVAAGDVKLQNRATLYGNLVAGGTVEMQNKAEVTGNVSYGGTFSNSGGTVGGWVRNDADVAIPDPVNWLIDEKRATFETSNNNSASAAVDDPSDELTGCGSTCVLYEGDYVLENVDLGSGDELVLDTSGGDVEVAVRDDVTIQGDAVVRVEGGGTAKFYLEDDLAVQNQGNVTVPDQRSPHLWFYMNPGASATVQNNGRFVGVVYGPGSGAQPGVDISLDNQAKVYGGVVGTVDTVNNGIGLHFDEALIQEDPLGGNGGGNPKVTYMHVTVNSVNVSSR